MTTERIIRTALLRSTIFHVSGKCSRQYCYLPAGRLVCFIIFANAKNTLIKAAKAGAILKQYYGSQFQDIE
jgi:hypothetical protein